MFLLHHQGQVIKAWDIGVRSMQKGEVCLLMCKPEYAYGSVGSPPKIPPNSTLLFEVGSLYRLYAFLSGYIGLFVFEICYILQLPEKENAV